MAINFPDLNLPEAIEIGACAKIHTEDRKIIDIFKSIGSRNATVAKFESNTSDMIARVYIGGESTTHFHVDLAKYDYLKLSDKQGKWRVNGAPDELESKLSFAEGCQANIFIMGRFALKVEDLGEDSILPSTFLENVEGKMAMRLTAAEITFDGGPINSLRWGLNDNTLFVELFSRVEMTIEPDYLAAIRDILFKSFDILVLGRRTP